MDGENNGLSAAVSEHQSDDFTFKGAAGRRGAGKGKAAVKDATPDVCTICLEAITERAVAVPCNHLTFDFLCLVQWLQEHATCPLCKATVREVQYDWRTPEDYKTYHVLEKHQKQSVENGGSRGRTSNQARHNFNTRRDIRWGPQPSRQTDSTAEDPGLSRRKQIYHEGLYSLHVGMNRISQYRDYTPASFALSPDLQSRARMFLRRELKVFAFLDNVTSRRARGNDREFVLEYIIALLKTNDVKGADGHAKKLVSELLGRDNAILLLHELDAWLRGPYTRLEDWDRHVQYADTAGRKEGKPSVCGAVG